MKYFNYFLSDNDGRCFFEAHRTYILIGITENKLFLSFTFFNDYL